MVRSLTEARAGLVAAQHPAQLAAVLAVQHKLPQLRAVLLLHGEPSLQDRRLQRSHRAQVSTTQVLCTMW